MDHFDEINVASYLGASSSRFPHMGPRDEAVWTGFLKLYDLSDWEIYYDFRLTRESDRLSTVGNPEAEMWMALKAKRLDVVLRRAGEVILVEVKPFATMAALGQLLVYAQLFDEIVGEPSTQRLLLVCFESDPDLGPSLASQGIMLSRVLAPLPLPGLPLKAPDRLTGVS
jgi:hypothetical protein